MSKAYERRIMNFPVKLERAPDGGGKITVTIPIFPPKVYPVPRADVEWLSAVLKILWPEFFKTAPSP